MANRANATQKLPPASERFLTQAATLTLEQWTTIYWRYVERPEVLKAFRKLYNVVTQAFLEVRRGMPMEQRGERDPVVMERNARIDNIVAVLPESELDPERGGHLRQRVEWFLVMTDNTLERADLVRADPKCRKPIRVLVSLFEDFIGFPEFA